MTNHELIKELAVYDGFTHHESNQYFTNNNDTVRLIYHEWYFNDYLTDMNILHRIAVKVYDEVINSTLDVTDINDLCGTINNMLLRSPNEQREYLHLAEALVNAIKYIQNDTA